MRMQLTFHKQNRNANTLVKSGIMHKQEGGKNPSPNSSLTFISSDSEGCMAVCSLATVSRKSSARGAQVLRTFNQSDGCARQNVLSLASQPPRALEGERMTPANIPLDCGGDSDCQEQEHYSFLGLDHGRGAQGLNLKHSGLRLWLQDRKETGGNLATHRGFLASSPALWDVPGCLS